MKNYYIIVGINDVLGITELMSFSAFQSSENAEKYIEERNQSNLTPIKQTIVDSENIKDDKLYALSEYVRSLDMFHFQRLYATSEEAESNKVTPEDQILSLTISD